MVTGPENVAFDETQWPFVLVTMPEGELGDDAFLAHVADLKAYSRRGQRFGLIIDARKAPVPNAARRRLVAEQMDAGIERDSNADRGSDCSRRRSAAGSV